MNFIFCLYYERLSYLEFPWPARLILQAVSFLDLELFVQNTALELYFCSSRIEDYSSDFLVD